MGSTITEKPTTTTKTSTEEDSTTTDTVEDSITTKKPTTNNNVKQTHLNRYDYVGEVEGYAWVCICSPHDDTSWPMFGYGCLAAFGVFCVFSIIAKLLCCRRKTYSQKFSDVAMHEY